MTFLIKIRRFIFLSLYLTLVLFLLNNSYSKISKEKELRDNVMQQYEIESRNEISKIYQTLKYLSYNINTYTRHIQFNESNNNIYKDLLEVKNILQRNYFLTSSLGADLDVAFLEDNRGVNILRSYNLDVFLKNHDLDISKLKNEINLIKEQRKFIYTYPGDYKKFAYIFTFSNGLGRNLRFNNLGNWYLIFNNTAYDLKSMEKANLNFETFSVYDDELKLTIAFKENSTIKKTIQNILIFYLLIPLIALFFICRYAATKLANKFYAPLKEIVQGIEIKNEDKKSELAYFLNYFDQLKVQNSSLKNKVNYMENTLRDKRIRDYIHGSISKNSIGESDEFIYNNTYHVCILNFESNDFKESLFIIKGELEKMIPNSIVLNIDNSIYMVLMEVNFSLSKNEVKNLLTQFQSKYSLEAQGFYSKNSFNVDKLYDSYKYFYKYLDYKFMLEELTLIDEDNVENEKGKTYYYPMELEQNWINKYLKGNFQGVKVIIDEIFNENFIERKINTKVFETLKILLFNSLKRLGNDDINEFKERFISIDNPKKLQEFLLYILKEHQPAIIPDSGKSNGNNDIIAQKIESFIEEYYSKDISLLDLAEHLGVSLQYASNLHKKVMGENFNQHLNRYRIEKAVYILKNDDSVKIKDLALMVGYINTNTFINNFKKIKGVSPGKYIK